MASGSTEPLVFISYSQQDVQYRHALDVHLRGRTIPFWADDTIQPGANWRLEIQSAMDRCSIAVFLVSAHFFASDYIQKVEVPYLVKKARQNRLVIISVILTASKFRETDLANFQALPSGLKHLIDMTPGQQDAEWESLARLLEEKVADATPQPWDQDNRLLPIADRSIPYISLLDRDARPLKRAEVRIHRETVQCTLAPEVATVEIAHLLQDDPSCRLIRFRADHDPLLLNLTFGPTWYSEYLRSAQLLRYPYPRDNERTYRDEFIRILPSTEFGRYPLSNITGAGLFIITKDEQVLISRHSRSSHVYPDRWTFSASGTCKWGVCPDPFLEIARKAHEEIGHQVDIETVALYELGVDAEHLYFQVSFCEIVSVDAADILAIEEKHPPNKDKPSKLTALSTQLDIAIPHLLSESWEPAAQAALLRYLAWRNRDSNAVDNALRKATSDWREGMRAYWHQRAERVGLLADMSVRYPAEHLEQGSADYVNKVLTFIGNDIDGRDVLEIGCGTGRISVGLAERAAKLTCVDHCARMVRRNKASFQGYHDRRKIHHRTEFAQEYSPQVPHDVCVCSLVLIHNVDETHFEALVRTIARSCRVAFVFEDTSTRSTSEHTRLRPVARLKEAFAAFGMTAVRAESHDLFGDDIAFIKFVR